MLDEKNNPHLLEINTMPGFTDISMFPKLWTQGEMTLPILLDKLIEFAL
jgi:D-alanine-D-alanine ligase